MLAIAVDAKDQLTHGHIRRVQRHTRAVADLGGMEIPLGARILSVVDCFDALTSDRPYRPRMTDDEAIEILRSRKGTFYDPAVVEKFIELIPELQRSDATVRPDRDAQARGSQMPRRRRSVRLSFGIRRSFRSDSYRVSSRLT